MAAEYLELEGGTDDLQLEDGTGNLLLESSTPATGRIFTLAGEGGGLAGPSRGLAAKEMSDY
jgi:hypothetical protein